MSMKRILGTMLASRMAGRGTRRGIGSGGLGGLAAAGMLGSRRGGFGRKAGLAALGYMAYRAYQDHVRSSGGTSSQFAAGHGSQTSAASGGATGSAASAGGLSAAIGDIVRSVGDALKGPQETQGAAHAGTPASSEPAFSPEDERAAEAFSEDTARLLVRAMITAANADGTITADERARIVGQAEEAGADDRDRHALDRELANPRPLDELLSQVHDRETAEEFYLASRMAVDETTEANRAYLTLLRERLGLGEEEVAEIESLAREA